MLIIKAMLICWLCLCGCAAVEEEAGQAEAPETLYSIDDHLTTAVVVVDLYGEIGTSILAFSAALPEAPQGDATLHALLSDGTVTITVSNPDGVTYAVASGIPLFEGPPDAPGEYTVDLAADRQQVTLQFFNVFEGHVMTAGETYTVAFDILPNPYFRAESFVRAVSVR